MRKTRSRRGVVVAAVAAAVIGVATYAFTASNSVPATSAGQGSATISGYNVGSVAYNLNASNPSQLDSVSFTLTPQAGNPAATTVQVQLVTGGSWTSCTVASGTWTCAPSGGVAVSAANELNVVAK
jgi:archaellin